MPNKDIVKIESVWTLNIVAVTDNIETLNFNLIMYFISSNNPIILITCKVCSDGSSLDLVHWESTIV